ncbi:non-ribosomal peptide synthetase, partial [Pedobacter sp. UYP1]|uniref:non-ribosomal peptide synthetase n=1 Tax=Pedobacter sp. UYP1 TaxID=1756396 RepID=UPI003391CFC1
LSIFELLFTLISGKKIRLLNDGLSIGQYLNSPEKLLLNTVPGVIGTLLRGGAELDSVSVLNMAGEPVPSIYIDQLDCERIEVRNLYGPTEDTVYSTVYRIYNDKPVLIGRPIANTSIYIVNGSDHLQAVGIAGEICIGGDGLARGYLHNAVLTAEKFVANPFEPGQRMYRTGDLGRWLEDGHIEYLGRKDDQVKIRGYRIELGEVEEALRSYSGIEGVVVTAGGSAEKELVAYVVSKEELHISAIRLHLSKILPNYMLPSHFVRLDHIPLNSNGKIDRKSLPDPSGLGLGTGIEYVAPTNEIEEKIVLIWQGILGKEKIGIKDNFFELGGHSLIAMKIFAQIHKEFNIKMKLTELFEKLTIEELGKDISRKMWALKVDNEDDISVNSDESFML